jgi:hypothetical protein
MYNVYKNNRKIKSMFFSYEEARQFVRKMIRQLDNTPRYAGQPVTPMFALNFSIKKIV